MDFENLLNIMKIKIERDKVEFEWEVGGWEKINFRINKIRFVLDFIFNGNNWF